MWIGYDTVMCPEWWEGKTYGDVLMGLMSRARSGEMLQRRGYSGKQKRWVEGDEYENEDGRQAGGGPSQRRACDRVKTWVEQTGGRQGTRA